MENYNMKTLMLICEIVIGLVGVFTIITGRDTHDRMHGIFVVLLCFCGLCDHFFSHFAIVSEAMLGITAIYALFFIVFFSAKDVHERVVKLKERLKGDKDKG